jgi:hypothetical protein
VVERSKHALRVDRLRTGNARTMPAFDWNQLANRAA